MTELERVLEIEDVQALLVAAEANGLVRSWELAELVEALELPGDVAEAVLARVEISCAPLSASSMAAASMILARASLVSITTLYIADIDLSIPKIKNGWPPALNGSSR